MFKSNSYVDKLKKIVLANDSNFHDIYDLNIIKAIDYSLENLHLLKDLISANKIEKLLKLPNEQFTNHDMIVISFFDRQGAKYLASFYDSDELWQDPELIEIYGIK